MIPSCENRIFNKEGGIRGQKEIIDPKLARQEISREVFRGGLSGLIVKIMH
jgi:hypothetical protein